MIPRVRKHRLNLHFQTDRLPFDGPEATALRIDAVFPLPHDIPEHRLQTLQVHSLKELIQIHGLGPLRHLFRECGLAVKNPVGIEFAVREFFRHELILLVFAEASHQFRSRVDFLSRLFIELARQQHARLDIEQSRRHQEKLGE